MYEGYLDGRPVAVKRLLRQFYDLAKKEIEVLVHMCVHSENTCGDGCRWVF